MSGADFALFWDKDIRLARAMEACGVRLYNRAGAVALCVDKAATQLALCRAGIPMPETLVAPMTYDHMAGPEAAFLEEAAARLGFPLVVKECFGSLGGQVYLAETGEDFCRLARTMGPRPFLAQRYIAESAGRGCEDLCGRRPAGSGDGTPFDVRFPGQYRQRWTCPGLSSLPGGRRARGALLPDFGPGFRGGGLAVRQRRPPCL